MSNNSAIKSLKIVKIGENQVLDFAAGELKKYLGLILKGVSITEQAVKECNHTGDTPDSNVIWLGLTKEFQQSNLFKVNDPQFDDAIYIDIKKGAGIVSGINHRSILLAVYRLLAEVGCRWLYPGDSGEFIPQMDVWDVNMKVCEEAAYRHRGICIEGAVSHENIMQIIDWACKNGFNAYFLQFREAFTFYERWYTHEKNPLKTPGTISVTQVREYAKQAEKEIKKRGMLYHAVGHGWTCEPLGLSGLSWASGDYSVAPEFANYLAEVNGKRAIWEGIPLNTNLCYSNPDVRELIVTNIVEYLAERPDIDLLHFWLADGQNNQCECDNCRKLRPSDFYVQMLNELDLKLAENKISTKIVFLIYVDLMWPPEQERLENPERFIIMFAPITRSYNYPFTLKEDIPQIPPYERNRLSFPQSVAENLAFLKEWQKQVLCDSFDFDYHMMWDHYSDPGYYQISEVLSEDIKNLKKIGLNGYISCQTQRTFFPTGLPMYVMGRTLWDTNCGFNELVEDYFRVSFGEDWKECRKYLQTISELFDPAYIRESKPAFNEKAVERFNKIPAYINDNKLLIEKNLRLKNENQAKAWNYLVLHGEFCSRSATMLAARARGEKEEALRRWEDLKNFLCENEDQIQTLFDVFEFIITIEIMRGDFFGNKEKS